MKDTKRLLITIGIVFILLISSFFLGKCTSECKTESKQIEVTVPEKEGSFESPKILIPQSSETQTVIKFKDTILYIPQVNEELVNKYLALEKETDIIKRENERLKLYTDAIKINKYKVPFEDDNLKLEVEAETEGKLLSLKPSTYLIKSQKIQTTVDIPKPKEKVFSLNLGAGLTTTKQLDKLDPSIHLDLVNKKGNILSTSYSVDGVIGIKYSINLFNIKK